VSGPQGVLIMEMIFSYQIGEESNFFPINKENATRMANIILEMETSEEYCNFSIHPHVGEYKKFIKDQYDYTNPNDILIPPTLTVEY
jgi:hypothetical protein